MSIQPNLAPNQWGAALPPSPTDLLFWRTQLQAEYAKFRHCPNRPNPELNEGVKSYWETLFIPEEKET